MHNIFDEYSKITIAQASQNRHRDIGTLVKVDDSFFDDLKRGDPSPERIAKIEKMKIDVKARGGIEQIDNDGPITKAKYVFVHYLQINYPLVSKKLEHAIMGRCESSPYLNNLKFLFDAVMIEGLADKNEVE
jgi:hypothetical protein